MVLALNGAVMSVLLAVASGKRMANRFLAALVCLISLRLVIYILGFAGVYDNYPNRSHFLFAEAGWEEIADDVLAWLTKKEVAPMAQPSLIAAE
jgi:hypothetical protein